MDPHKIGDVPTMKMISDRFSDSSYRSARANMNFQIAVALACLLDTRMSLICTSSRICLDTKLLLDKIFIRVW